MIAGGKTMRVRAAAKTAASSRRQETAAFSNLEKKLYPSGFTKGQVIDYYRGIAPVLLPHLKDRALTLKRYPNGSMAPFFFEKRCPSHRPAWVRTAPVPRRTADEGDVHHCVADDLNTLLWVANLASLELHVLLSKVQDASRPTMMVFDLDPGAPATIVDCARLALEMRGVLEHFGLESFAKTSGGKGIHFYVPLNTPTDFDQTKEFSRAIAMLMERQNPGKITSRMSKSLRPGKVFIDWSQNDLHKTTACVYTLRAMDCPMVSTPVAWEELQEVARDGDASSIAFDAPKVLERAARMGDLFEPVLRLKQKLPRVLP